MAQISGVVNERALAEVKAGLRKINDVVSNTPGGRMGILGYAGETKRLIESGTSSEVDAALGKMAIDSEASETHMIDAVRTAIDLLKAQDKGRRKLIVLFSDGIDVNNDKKGFVDIGNRAQQAGIVIDTIGYNEFDPPKLRNLQEMAKRCYGIDRIAKTPTELGPRFDAVVDEIQKQYVITFPLSIIGDDKEHTFQVKHEAGGKPVELGYELNTIAHNPFDDTLHGTFSAHPHRDECTGSPDAKYWRDDGDDSGYFRSNQPVGT